MKMNSKLLGIIILVVIFGGIALSSALGWWNTENSAGGGNGQGSGASSGSEGTGSELIRGRTTFQDLLDLGLPPATIEQVIGGAIPSPQTRINTYCAQNGLDFETIKEMLLTEVDKLK